MELLWQDEMGIMASIMKDYTLKKLKDIAKNWEIKGYTTLKKEDLIVKLERHIAENVLEKFKTFNFDHLTIIFELFKGNNVFSLYPEAAGELLDLGLILEKTSDHKEVVMPNHIFEAFKNFYALGQDLLGYNTILKDFMDLAVSLYGVVTISEMASMFKNFYDTDGDVEVIQNNIAVAVLKTKYALQDSEFIHYYRLKEFGKVYSDIQTKDNLVYKTIDLDQMQSFIQNDYSLWQYNYESLYTVMRQYFEGDRQQVIDLVDEFKIMMSYNHGLSDFIQLFSKKHPKADMMALKAFADAIISFSSEVPHWELKGHTPMDLSEHKKQMPIVKEDKIQRNEPCPCGSGKKYKKCCMN